MQTQPQTEKLTPPGGPGEWSLNQIIAALSRPLPEKLLSTRKQGGQTIKFISWYVANSILDRYCPAWTWEIRQMQTTADRLFIIGRLTIPTSDGLVWREATGTETLKEEKLIKAKQGEDWVTIPDEYGRPMTELKEISYGDPASISESMAFRRAAAKFGLGLYLYSDKSAR